MAGAACLVLDFDGTILDTEEPVYSSWQELWAAHGHSLERSEWQQIIGTQAGFDPWAELETRLGRPVDPAWQDRRRARRDELQARHGPRPGIAEWLADADRLGVAVGVASSSPWEWVNHHLLSLGLRDRVECLACADGDIPAKPDPSCYRLACEWLGADPRMSVAVEDSPNGVSAAVGARLYTVAVPHGLTADLNLSAADVVVESLDSLTLAEALERAARRPL